jgi:hypothetical protein
MPEKEKTSPSFILKKKEAIVIYSVMKICFMIAAFALLLLSASCNQSPKNPLAEHGDAMIDAYQKSKVLRDTASLSSVKTAIQTFYAEKGRYPADLSEIKDLLGVEYDLSIYSYDPAYGSVSLK